MIATVNGQTAPDSVVTQPEKFAGSSAQSYYWRGRSLMEEGQFAEAIPLMSEALRRDPTLAIAYNGRGYAHLRLRHYGEAILDFDQAIRLNPAYANAHLNRSVARRASGDKTGADADLARAKELTRAAGK